MPSGVRCAKFPRDAPSIPRNGDAPHVTCAGFPIGHHGRARCLACWARLIHLTDDDSPGVLHAHEIVQLKFLLLSRVA